MKRIGEIFTMLLTISTLTVAIYAKPANKNTNLYENYLSKILLTRVTRTLSNISNWSYWMYYDGKSGIKPDGTSGGIYPRGTAGVIFEDGFIIGGLVDGSPRVVGQTYVTGTVAGWITESGPVSRDDERVKIWRIRPDYKTLTHSQLVQDAAELNMIDPKDVTEDMTKAIMEQYAEDWENWPGDLGAPFIDKNGNGVWDGSDVDEPGIANADQVVWFVCNDMDKAASKALYGSDPIGIEIQVTAWAYAQPGARLGQLIFKRYRIINKSGKTVENAYVAQWCDPDVGDAGDDLLGCDTTLGIGYAYNGYETDNSFDAFGLAPAAIGYDFFQGPLVPGVAGQDLNKNGIDDAEDYGLFEFKKRPGFINLPMTTFAWFSAGSDINDPDLGDYTGTLQWYNMLRGYKPFDDIENPQPWYVGNDPNLGTTKFPLAGDPVTGEGDVDGTGKNFPPGDRRMALCSGPFTFAPGDTQDIVVAIIGGLGDSRLSSVTDLKTTDLVAQKLYDEGFAGIPKAPSPPNVKAIPFENSIVLNWGFDEEAVKATEETEIAGYAFEGYNVYQLPSRSASKDEAVLIATFDKVNGVKKVYGKKFLPEFGEEVIVPVQFGSDRGVQRYIVIEKDYITSLPLYEGNTYYFAVTAYNYNPEPSLIEDKALESPLTAIAVTVQEPKPGDEVSYLPEEEVSVEHKEGPSDGQVRVKVIDPYLVTGHTYEIHFSEVTDTTSELYGKIVWSVLDSNLNEVVVSNQPQVTNVSEGNDAPIFDGVQVIVAGPEPGIKAIVELDPETGEIYDSNLWGSLNNYGRSQGWPTFYIQESSPNFDLSRVDRFGLMTPKDYEIIFTDSDSTLAWDYYTDKVLQDTLTGKPTFLPLTFWRIDLDGTRTRLPVCVLDQNESGTWDRVFEGVFGPGYELLYVYDNAEYKPEDVETYISTDDGTVAPGYGPWGVVYPAVNRLCFGMYKDVDGYADPSELDENGYFWGPPHAGEHIKIITTKPNTENDVFVFRTKAPILGSEELAKEAVKKINVFPNPYYAYNALSDNMYDNYVTFTHLPAKATIRIFTLSGIEVRKLEKDDPNSQFLRWDLKNEKGLPVASGLYIAYVDLPDLKKQKILKFFIIQSEQILEYY
ncbi:MAG: hypothetical protein H0Z30_05855 [Candidatus Marinimicrobia bacterium]|nr:hypothetical protein [Candidatus Neomarinimicrobiota bacterium]